MRLLMSITVLFFMCVSAGANNVTAGEIESLRALVDVGTNGGGTYLFHYDIDKFDYSLAIEEMLKQTAGSDCSFVVVRGRRQMDKKIGLFASFSSSREAQKIVKKLILENKVKAAVGYYWDGATGDIEYCSKEGMVLYFFDGQALSVDFDSTT